MYFFMVTTMCHKLHNWQLCMVFSLVCLLFTFLLFMPVSYLIKYLMLIADINVNWLSLEDLLQMAAMIVKGLFMSGKKQVHDY